MNERSSFLTTPLAILLGSFVISVTILMHGGIIKVGPPGRGGEAAAPAAQAPAAQPQAAKTEADIVNGLKEVAQNLGLNEGDFNSCLDSGDKAAEVQKDAEEGSKAGVSGTPAFFINGRLISGAVPFEQFKVVIDEELNGTSPSTVTRQEVGVGNLPAQGNANAKVTLIEFSDYECPFCSRHYTQAEAQINKEYVDKGLVKFYYRDFPLTQIHPGAQKAAEAARCAGDQGKYWEYHDEVFENQTSLF